MELLVVQRRIGPGGTLITPKLVVVTDKRLIIGSRTVFRLKRSFEIIHFNWIRRVKLEHGLISSTVVIISDLYGKDEGEAYTGYGVITGLRYEDAVELVKLINKKTLSVHQQTGVTRISPAKPHLRTAMETYIRCRECGAENKADSNFCSNCGTKWE
ncbi:MAG: zinc ribbon domain-containing protein [Candidatus Micrarchaeota archaeon]|nr:zinc ribbon domain-containing protein [Candidatus Micrarchaeota archaeon]